MSQFSKAGSFQTLERLLGDAFTLHQRGSGGARLGRCYGMADGYMLALLDLGIATQQELTRVVAAARAGHLGAASSVLGTDAAGEPRSERDPDAGAQPSGGVGQTRAA